MDFVEVYVLVILPSIFDQFRLKKDLYNAGISFCRAKYETPKAAKVTTSREEDKKKPKSFESFLPFCRSYFNLSGNINEQFQLQFRRNDVRWQNIFCRQYSKVGGNILLRYPDKQRVNHRINRCWKISAADRRHPRPCFGIFRKPDPGSVPNDLPLPRRSGKRAFCPSYFTGIKRPAFGNPVF